MKMALIENGVDENMHDIESPSLHAVLKNITKEEISAFSRRLNFLGCCLKIFINYGF
jgi:hypothetical protein